ncbi:Protein JINGUBANG, partial [Cucurbita argyrosperma subsp. sororia]
MHANANAMAFHANNSLLSIMLDDEKQTTMPQRERVMGEQPGSKAMKPTPPPSPESPWMLSPLRTPSPLLLHHCIASLHRGEGNIYSIAISNGVVFTGSDSCRVRAWKQPDCMDRGYLKAAAGGVWAIAAYGNMLFTSHRDSRIRVWNFTASHNLTSKKLCSLPKRTSFLLFSKTETTHLHKDTISCMAYYHAQDLLYTASHDKTVKAWRISDRKCVDSFLAHEDKVNSITVNKNDGCLFTCSSDGTVKIWRCLYRENSHTLTMTLKFQTSPVNAVVLSSHSDGETFLYSGSSDGTINFWEKERVSYRYNHGGFLQGHRFGVLCLAVVERLVLSGSEDTTVRIWRKEEGGCYHECLAVLDGHRGPVRCLAGSLEMENMEMSFLVYSGSLDQSFKVWRVKVMLAEEENNGGDLKMNKLYEMSPVLSPSWVEKKLQASNY